MRRWDRILIPLYEAFVPWDGRSERGLPVPGGTYFLRATLRTPAETLRAQSRVVVVR